ncbi:MAG: DEAD/DEAH box helicase [Euryarchaeota archaeon]|nr:DEAD/DEAH box helicase [Euryarchaeota archaeon]
MSFENLGLNECVLDAIRPLGYEKPTPIQEQSIPFVLEGKDLLGCAQTGTGKTAAFALPIVHTLSSTPPKHKGSKKPVRALVISPTRELTSQINDNFRDYCSHSSLRNTVIYGGVSQHRQVSSLRRGVDILVATPGRLLDLCNQGFINLNTIEFLVLDEADTMLDMGFLPDIKKIIKQCPEKRQTLFFSATMPKDIVKLSSSILTDPERVQIDAENSAAVTVEQKIYSVRQNDKKDLLVHILQDESIYNALVFTRTKYGADKVERHLRNNKIKAEAIHGNKSQAKREKALERFKKGKVQVLVATDIASRGIDVDVLDLVVNFELPNLPESYVHRIGRTGRAGNEGLAISFCNEGSERNHLAGIQKLLGKEIEIVEDHPFALEIGRVGMDPKPSGKCRKKNRSRDRGGSKKFDGRRNDRRRDNKKRDDNKVGDDKRHDDKKRDDRRRDDRWSDDRRREDRRRDDRRRDDKKRDDRRRDQNKGRRFESSGGGKKRGYKSTEASASENKTHFKKKKKRDNKFGFSPKKGESSSKKPQIGRRGAKKTKFKGR